MKDTSNGFTKRHFIGGVANGRIMALPKECRLFSVPQPPSDPAFINDNDVRIPDPPDDYTLRVVIDPIGNQRDVMVLSSISNDILIEMFNKKLHPTFPN